MTEPPNLEAILVYRRAILVANVEALTGVRPELEVQTLPRKRVRVVAGPYASEPKADEDRALGDVLSRTWKELAAQSGELGAARTREKKAHEARVSAQRRLDETRALLEAQEAKYKASVDEVRIAREGVTKARAAASPRELAINERLTRDTSAP